MVLFARPHLTCAGHFGGHGRYVPPEAPPDPDAPPTLTQAEDEAMTTEYDFEGYLMKKGGGKRLFGRKNWQKRYFVMIDAQLAYFKSQQACV